MTSYLDPYTLEESMREIRSSRKEIERLRTEVLDLKATIQIYVRELAELRKARGEPVGEMIVEEWYVGDTVQSRWKPMLYEENELPPGTKLYTSAPTIPEGWQLVPMEPTPEMYAAASHLVTGDWKGRGFEYPDELFEAYRAMLAAAPKQKETK